MNRTTDTENFGLWSRMSVGRKIATIAVLFLLALTGIIGHTVSQIAGREGESAVMDFAGRQRELSTLYARDVVQASSGLPADLQYWAKVFEETTDALLDGGMVTTTLTKEGKTPVPPAPSQEIRDRLLAHRDAFRDLVTQGRLVLATKPDDPSYRSKANAMFAQSMKARLKGSDATKAFDRYYRDGLQRMITNQLIIGAAVGLLGILLSWAITRGIVTPLLAAVAMAEGIARGDLRQPRLVLKTRDEVGRLAEAFNLMQDSLKDITEQTHQGTLNLNGACQEIQASTQQQATSAREQASAVQETTATIEQIRQAGVQIAERAKLVVQAAAATSSASRSGLQAVQETTSTMDRIREQVEAVAENVVSLSEKTQAVGEIISSVNDIAEQSHLLALNAAIEAASAGEAGRSFSVVASEVKNLADQAKQATIQVRSILGEIQKGITGSVMLTEEAVKRVDGGKKQAEVTERTIKELSDTTLESVHAFQQTVATTNQQQIGYDQVTQAMQDIRRASEQTAAGTSQLEKASVSLTALSQQLRRAVERFQL